MMQGRKNIKLPDDRKSAPKHVGVYVCEVGCIRKYTAWIIY